jgi:NhaA family Na+:H+ antiporter
MARDFAAPRFATLAAFFRGGAAGGVVLMLAAAIALVLANSPVHDSYEALLALPLGVSAGKAAFVQSLEGWVNDALMAVFFLLVGLEIRRELTEGQLASVRRAAAPALAALGGMLVPAAIYVAFAWRDPSAMRGWAIPMATDIAFSLAVLRVLGRRVPAGLKVFLTALAILDDLGAILVIALFYTAGVEVPALVAAALVWLGLFLLARAGLRALGPYMIGFVLLWACLARSGVHPTLAGVAVAFVVPMEERDGVSPAHTLEDALTGWVAYAVLPLFGLANAGLSFGSLSLHSLADPVVPGIVLGLFVGKQVGVAGVTWLAFRLRLAHLPAQLTWGLLYGAALLCGIGFTMSLFIGQLAFPTGERQAELKLAVFAGSLISALAGLVVLRLASRSSTKPVPSQSVKGVAPQTTSLKP